MHILITGGAGFIGSNLSRAALADGHRVTVLDDLSTGYRENLDGLDLRFIEGSLLDASAVSDSLSGVDRVVHLGALGSVPRSISDPRRTHDVNITGTLNVLEGMRSQDVPHIVFASSSSVYGLNPALPKSERAWVRPLSPYAVTKLAGEQYVLAYQQSFGLKSLPFRFFNVYGPRQRPGHAYAAVIPIFLEALRRGETLPVNGDGTQSRDFTFVATVCSTLLRASTEMVESPEPVNLAFGTKVSLLDLIDLIAEVTGLTPEIEHRETRKGDVPHSQADNARLTALFPGISATPLADGIRETWKWLIETNGAPLG